MSDQFENENTKMWKMRLSPEATTREIVEFLNASRIVFQGTQKEFEGLPIGFRKWAQLVTTE